MRKAAIAFILFVAAMLAAGLFGAAHDQVSYSVSEEYFTKFKFIQFGLVDSPLSPRLRVALIGFLASWHMGIPAGLVVARLAFQHPTPSAMLRFGLRSFAVILSVTALIALGGLAYGYVRTGTIDLAEHGDWFIPAEIVQLRRYLCVGYMHHATYLGGAWSMIGFTLFHYIARKRKQCHPAPIQQRPFDCKQR